MKFDMYFNNINNIQLLYFQNICNHFKLLNESYIFRLQLSQTLVTLTIYQTLTKKKKRLKKNFKLKLSLNQYYKQCLSLRPSKSPKACARLGLAWFISQAEIKLNIKFKLLIKIQYKYIIKPILSIFLCLFCLDKQYQAQLSIN